ncbi:uncharacterized protein PG998_003590 [Apiospora kogelbergensis]|uniref:uncharacterized protein n=1 Tax=Apiospora kogelbergensis TaxID=1337665 RepID=UPI0031326D7C
MRSLSLLTLASLCHLSFQTQLRTQTDGFRSPGYIGNRKVDPLAAVEVWKVGEPRIVAFDAPWTEYGVELWQSVGADHANRTSHKVVYQQLLGQNLPRNFNWTVDSYDLKLSDSNMFFFWLRDPSDAARSVTSPYFNMTTDASAATPNTFFSYGGIEDSPGDSPTPRRAARHHHRQRQARHIRLLHRQTEGSAWLCRHAPAEEDQPPTFRKRVGRRISELAPMAAHAQARGFRGMGSTQAATQLVLAGQTPQLALARQAS